jgi:4-amino-4-deoxychorismate lyase
MYPFFETICVRDGIPENIAFHRNRMERTKQIVYGQSGAVQIEEHLIVPEAFRLGIVRCRIEYGHEMAAPVFSVYQARSIRSLRLVNADTLSYALKYTDRSSLYALLQQRGDADDILIVKNGNLTDTSFANLVFSDGKHWYTPENPLLEGTRRASLLEKGLIRKAVIRPTDLQSFQSARLINAMLPLEAAMDIDVRNIF